MLDSRENNTQVVTPVNLLNQLIFICAGYRKDYFFTKNTHDFIAQVVIKLATYINALQKFGCLKLDARDEYKQLLLRNLILALRQYLRGKPDEKLNAKIAELIRNNASILLAENENEIDMNAKVISKFVEFFSQHNTNVNLVANKCIKIFESYLEMYTNLHSEKSISFSDLPAEVVLDFFKPLSLQERYAFGVTSKGNFSLFNSTDQWKSWFLNSQLDRRDRDFFISICRDDQNTLMLLAQARMSVGRFIKRFIESHYAGESDGDVFNKPRDVELLFKGVKFPSSSRLLKNIWHICDVYISSLNKIHNVVNEFDNNFKAQIVRLIARENKQGFFARIQKYTLNYILLYNLHVIAAKATLTKELTEPLDAAMFKAFPSSLKTLPSLIAATIEFKQELVCLFDEITAGLTDSLKAYALAAIMKREFSKVDSILAEIDKEYISAKISNEYPESLIAEDTLEEEEPISNTMTKHY